MGGRAAAIGVALAGLDTERQQLANAIADCRSRIGNIDTQLRELTDLEKRCAGRQPDVVRAERDQLTFQALELRGRVEQAQTARLDQIERRLNAALKERERIRRQIESRTVSHLLTEAELSDTQRPKAALTW